MPDEEKLVKALSLQERKEAIEVKNTADSTVYTVEKMLEEYGDKLPAELKTQV